MVSDILIYCLKTILTIGNMSQSRLTKDWSMMITKWESCVNTGHWCNLALRPCCMVASSIWGVFLPPSPHPGHAFLCLVSHPLCNCLGKMSCLDTLSKDSGCDNNSAWMINPYMLKSIYDPYMINHIYAKILVQWHHRARNRSTWRSLLNFQSLPKIKRIVIAVVVAKEKRKWEALFKKEENISWSTYVYSREAQFSV